MNWKHFNRAMRVHITVTLMEAFERLLFESCEHYKHAENQIAVLKSDTDTDVQSLTESVGFQELAETYFYFRQEVKIGQYAIWQNSTVCDSVYIDKVWTSLRFD